MCVWYRIYTCSCEYVGVCMCVGVWTPEVDVRYVPLLFSILYFEARPLIEARLANGQVPWILSPLPEHRDCRHTPALLAF